MTTMTDNTPDTSASELTAEVSATGATSRNSYEITPELRPHADAILAMDPVKDVPPPYEIPEGWGANLTLRATALPAEMQREVNAKLDALGEMAPEQRQAMEAQLTAESIRAKTRETRILTGVGKDATPFHRELVAIARDYRDLTAEYDRIQDELAEVERYETQTDPATGEPTPVPVYRLSGARAQAALERQDDIARRLRLLVNDDGHGIEAQRRLGVALHESAVARKEHHRQLDEAAEVKRRAAEMAREKRINEQAAALARLDPNGA